MGLPLLIWVLMNQSHADGFEFTDNFNEFRTDIWNKSNDILHCSKTCVYLDQDNIRIVPHSDSMLKNSLQLSLRNDCFGPWCCKSTAMVRNWRASIPKEYCTRYSTGKIISKDSYKYGSFRFLVKAAHVGKHIAKS